MEIEDERAVYKRAVDKNIAGRKKYWMMVVAMLLITVALSISMFTGWWRQDDTGW